MIRGASSVRISLDSTPKASLDGDPASGAANAAQFVRNAAPVCFPEMRRGNNGPPGDDAKKERLVSESGRNLYSYRKFP